MFQNSKKPIIAMLYLPASIAHKNYLGLEESFNAILSDLKKIHEAGFEGICLENEKDTPYKIKAERHDIAFYTLLVRKIVENSTIPVGFNYLLNDPKTSLAVANTCQADFIRTDYFVDEMIRESDQRVMEADPQGVSHYREKIGAQGIKLYADVQVKHATMVQPRSLKESVLESIEYGADGVIVSGSWTGKAPDLGDIEDVKEIDTQVIIGSGFNIENASTLLPLCDGVIVGTAILTNDGRVDSAKATQLMKTVKKIRTS